ncbi:oxidoreductase [Vibrio alfacsensis]|uniref:Oxidoreductase n=1 Tax=Vibrio alfacsensis TaxID=1074311 RepID=A0ABM6YX47_9VIBR|nr:oxidoreductase [Vibrio alfacsensis]
MCSKNIQIDTQTSTAGVAKASKRHAQKNSDQFLNVDGNELSW